MPTHLRVVIPKGDAAARARAQSVIAIHTMVTEDKTMPNDEKRAQLKKLETWAAEMNRRVA